MTFQWKPVQVTESVRRDLLQLLQRGTSLAQAFADRVAGAAFIALPEDVDPASVTSFEHGGVCQLNPSTKLVAATIERYLKLDGDHLVVLQDWMARPEDEILKHLPVRWCDIEGEVYYILTPQSETAEIEAGVRKAMDVYSFFCALTRSGMNSRKNQLGGGTIQEWARSTTAGILSICDGESFLFVSEAPQNWHAVILD